MIPVPTRSPRRPLSVPGGAPAGATCPGLFPSSDGPAAPYGAQPFVTVEPGRLPSDAPGVIIRITVLHLGGREICAEDARDMGLTAGAIVGPREWAVLLGHGGKVWGRVG